MIDVGCKRLFACDECPIVTQLESRLSHSDMKPYGFQFDHCSCDKVDDEFFMCGYCEDAWVDRPEPQKKGERKTGRAYRRQMRVKKFERQKNIVLHCGTMEMGLGLDKTGLPADHAFPLMRLGIDTDEIPVAYIKRRKSSKTKGFYKRRSNRTLRKDNIVLPKGNQYRKYTEYWWELY